jgi:heterotetrameric sarcosine oxidase gamma subunit
MLEYRSPLKGADAPRWCGDVADAGPSVSFRGRRPAPIVQLAGWSDFEARAAQVLRPLGFADVGDFRICRWAGQLTLLRIAPDRVLVIGAAPTALLQAAAQVEDLAALDLSHARHEITVSGRAVKDVLARLCAIDLRDSALPVDGFAQTGSHGIAMLIWRTAPDMFSCLVPTTWALSVWDLFCLNAAPFGYEILPSENDLSRPADRPARPMKGEATAMETRHA